MSKQYMTIQFSDRTATVKTNSEKAIKMAIKKIYSGLIGEGAVKTIEIKGNVIKFTYTEEKQFWGYWQPTSTGRVTIIENTFTTEETAEVVEAPATEVVEAPAVEVVEAPAAEVVEAPARIVEDVDASYDDDAIDEALDAIRDAVIAGRPYARLIEEAHGLGCSRYAIREVIIEAAQSLA